MVQINENKIVLESSSVELLYKPEKCLSFFVTKLIFLFTFLILCDQTEEMILGYSFLKSLKIQVTII